MEIFLKNAEIIFLVFSYSLNTKVGLQENSEYANDSHLRGLNDWFAIIKPGQYLIDF